jgi:hypothetical protein
LAEKRQSRRREKTQEIETMAIYRLVTIGEEVSLTLRWAESEDSRDAIRELVEWTEANNFNLASTEEDLTNPECDCAIERFDFNEENQEQ